MRNPNTRFCLLIILHKGITKQTFGENLFNILQYFVILQK